MTVAEWRFSAQLAWQDRFIRWMTISNLVVVIATSTFVLWKLIPEGARSGVLTMHYTIYLGIDDVRAWPWIFMIPGGLLCVQLVNLALAYGFYRTDKLAARALISLAAAVALLSAVSSFFLVLINL